METQVNIFVVNAFTANDSGGNPAGVVLDADQLSDEQCLFIAKKLGFSETAFVSKSNKATHRVRFFTPTEEVDLCGHATIATWSLMHQEGLHTAGIYYQDTAAGKLGIKVSEDGLIFMEQAQSEFYETVQINEIAPSLGIEEIYFDRQLKPQVVSTGLKDLLVAVKDADALARIRPNFEAMIALSKKHDVTGLHVFCMLDKTDFVVAARNFAPLVGIPEEAATGTSNGATLCYLRQNKTLPKRVTYRIEQGRSMGNLSCIYGKFNKDIVWIGGSATVVSRQNLTL